MKRITFSLIAEYVAIVIYKIKFYQILYHRKRYYVGEIDIIALRGKQLVFIEVKARRSDVDDRILSTHQQARIKRSASVFLSSNPKYQNYQVRFDLIIIKPYSIPIIIENAYY
ncbi:YraN family protein [Candidatus Tisiphia endosymbiont of Dioctria rufipes]|uniref:YraN family protein n=1 Tax=Candidatus Tisiphia endosymbiont of Dioctria rufipes TaxID=3066255 RepID=UPI00312C99FC